MFPNEVLYFHMIVKSSESPHLDLHGAKFLPAAKEGTNHGDKVLITSLKIYQGIISISHFSIYCLGSREILFEITIFFEMSKNKLQLQLK